MFVIKNGDLSIGVDVLPGHKKPSLVKKSGNHEYILGTFNGTKSVMDFFVSMASIMNIYQGQETWDSLKKYLEGMNENVSERSEEPDQRN